MVYKKKVLFLSSVVGVLALLYAGTWIFEPERVHSRNAAFQWLDPKRLDEVDRIELSGSSRDPLTLIRKEAAWFVSRDDGEYPAKQGRIEDFLRILSTKGAYPVRGTETASHERLGLTEAAASRILIRGGAAADPLLDLLVGSQDPTGREVYLRKQGQPEIRSGNDILSGYISSSKTAWYNLRLFPEAENSGLGVDSVQRITVYPLASSLEQATEAEEPSAPEGPFSLSRSQEGWIIEGASVPELDTQRVESYIRSIVDAEGEDFIPAPAGIKEDGFNQGQIILELGNGLRRSIRIGPALDSNNQRSALVSDTPFIYALAEWTMSRLFRTASYFEKP
ncbi:MAG: DUF4340 domain-containing protein [Treponema sp.]|jgi:hypothetical protein|nr:DUF4340 domain-containing protein [Treponema sp.]